MYITGKNSVLEQEMDIDMLVHTFYESVPVSHADREYLAPQISSMNNRFHSEAKLPWSYKNCRK